MKISSLKKLIREAVKEELSAMEARLAKRQKQAIQEVVNSLTGNPLGDVIGKSVDTSAIRAKFLSGQSVAGYGEGLTGALTGPPIPRPTNERATLGSGEQYASGENLLEWFKGQKTDDATAAIEHTKSQGPAIDALIDRTLNKV